MEVEKERALKKIALEKKRVQRRLELHRAELEEAQNFAALENEVHLLQAHYARLKRGMKELVVEDFEDSAKTVAIQLNPKLLPEEEIEKRFKLLRKYKRRRVICKELIVACEKKLVELEAAEKQVIGAENLEALAPYFPQEKTAKQPLPRKRFKEFTTEAQFKILVGKSDRDNDELTFKIAKGNDLWFHASNFPGSHVILQVEGREVDAASLRDAMQLALHFSKAKGKGAQEVVYTESKWVRKPKKAAPGQVLLSQHKTKLIQPDSKVLQRFHL